jgi:beta-xylosidase
MNRTIEKLERVAAIVACVFGLVCGSPAAPATYTNPVYDGDMPDPTVIRYNGVYYAFGTTGKQRIDGRIFKTLRSTNLVDWQLVGGALIPPSENTNYEYWAPEITFADGKFYLYYATGGVEPEKFENRVATSVTPEGPYTDTGHVLADCSSNRFTIDPFPFRDDDGKWYFFYAEDFTNTDNGAHVGTGIVVDRLVDMTRLAGDCHVVVRPRFDWTLYEANRRMDVFNGTFDWHTIEGPYVLKHDGRYYCIYSGSKYSSTHYGLDFVVADNPLGPYSGQGDQPRVLHQVAGHVRGPGHNDIVTGPDGTTQFFLYHAWDSAMTKRCLCIDKLAWTADGPRCECPTYTPQPVP